MALRVLLADESVTIKKVIQLALQDFAVEVKAVPVGLDVLEVSKSFQPDLVFADILLQKRSGYEVCADLKKDPTTAAIPVVLMWSSFMELDQRQVDACGADGRLEKPFEVEALRKLVLELVPRTRSQRLAHFLEYPATVSAPLREEANSSARAREAQAPPPVAPPTKAPSMPPPAAPVSAAGGAVNTVTAEPPSRPEIPKPKMPPPLSTPKAPAANPFGGTLGSGVPSGPITPPSRPPARAAREEAAIPTDLTPTPTPGIPDRPPEIAKPKVEAPLGALPDLQLEGTFETTSSGAKPGAAATNWNMESFEPLDLSPLSLSDDEGEDEAFQPIQLPQVEPAPAPATFGAALSLTADDDDDDAEADQWSNSSLDKYRLPPLKPEESLAVDERTPDFGLSEPSMSRPAVQQDSKLFTPPDSIPSFMTDKTEIIPQPPAKKPTIAPQAQPQDDVPEFSLSADEFDETSRLEIEPVDHSEKTKPEIVRELLRDPDFSYGDETVRQQGSNSVPPRARNFANHENAIDLSRAGTPAEPTSSFASSSLSEGRIEEMVRDQVAPQLEKMVERTVEKAVEKIVSQMLPQIAERIIKRELERLLEES